MGRVRFKTSRVLQDGSSLVFVLLVFWHWFDRYYFRSVLLKLDGFLRHFASRSPRAQGDRSLALRRAQC